MFKRILKGLYGAAVGLLYGLLLNSLLCTGAIFISVFRVIFLMSSPATLVITPMFSINTILSAIPMALAIGIGTAKATNENGTSVLALPFKLCNDIFNWTQPMLYTRFRSF